MLASEMVTKFIEMVDDQLSSTMMYQILNDAKNEIEGSHIWEQLKAMDSSQTETQSSIALPTRFALPIRLTIGTEYDPYTLVPFEDQRQYQTYSRAFYIDFANSVYYLTGTRTSANTIYLAYTKYTIDLTSSDTWAFPSRFHDIIPLKMAQIYYATNAGEKARAWDDRWKAQFDSRLQQMQAWDDQLKLRANRGRRAMYPSDLPKGIVSF